MLVAGRVCPVAGREGSTKREVWQTFIPDEQRPNLLMADLVFSTNWFNGGSTFKRSDHPGRTKIERVFRSIRMCRFSQGDPVFPTPGVV